MSRSRALIFIVAAVGLFGCFSYSYVMFWLP